MTSMRCNACNSEFEDGDQQKLHYKSEWHRFNLKRKVAGVPGVTEALFQARQAALANERNKSSETPMLFSCAPCGKGYRSSEAHSQHLKSRAHVMRVSQVQDPQNLGITVIRPLKSRVASKPTAPREMESEESEGSGDEWVEVDENDDEISLATESIMNLNVNEPNDDMDDGGLDPSCCFICDLKHKSIESCMVHLHKQHGFFIPDIEYLKDPEGFLTYVGLKVKRDFMCLYCNDGCHPFLSLEAVRKHMIAKGHCKVRFGDGGDDEEAELEEFYDYSSSYADVDGKQLVSSDDMANTAELGSGGSELIITRKTGNGVSVRTLGSREFLRYYRQKPRPSLAKEVALAIALVSRYSQVQEHGFGDSAVKRTNCEDENFKGDEWVRNRGNAVKDWNEE